jgi:SM-20-related protein
MPKPELLASLGLYIDKNFLDEETCTQIRTAMIAKGNPATVYDEKQGTYVDEKSRKSKRVRVSEMPPDLLNLLTEKFDALTPVLAEHFKIPLTAYQKLDLLRYETGDFFKPHKDNNGKLDSENYVTSRKVSAVVFLNTPSQNPDEPDSYSGGALSFYGLLEGEKWENISMAIDAHAGLLVAFRSETVHEVSEITSGERFTSIAWYY